MRSFTLYAFPLLQDFAWRNTFARTGLVLGWFSGGIIALSQLH
jgi:hypothetical protein